jgi:hypothetical protein
MSYNAKNYTEQGGEKTVIGGEIVINGKITVSDGGEIAGFTGVAEAATDTVLGGVKAAAKGEGDTVEVKINTSTSKLYVPTYPVVPEEATTDTAGTVKQAANVALAAAAAPTKAEFDALITALIEAGLMASGAAE